MSFDSFHCYMTDNSCGCSLYKMQCCAMLFEDASESIYGSRAEYEALTVTRGWEVMCHACHV